MGFNKLFKREKIYNVVVFKHFQYTTNSIIITDYIKNEKTAIYNKKIERVESEYEKINNNCQFIHNSTDSSCNRTDSFCNISNYKNN